MCRITNMVWDGMVDKMPAWDVIFNPRLNTKDEELLRLIIQIEAYRLSILKIPLPPAFRRDLNQVNIIRQVRGTTGIEGNSLEEEEIAKILPGAGGEMPGAQEGLEEREVRNAYEVVRRVTRLQVGGPLTVTEDLVRELHAVNTEGCGYPNNIPGQYRQVPVAAGDYRPPAPDAIPGLMRQFVDFINSREIVEGVGTLIRAVLAHFYLVSIHPFGDGNGRASRALEACILYSGGYNVHGFYSLANFYYKHRAEYIQKLQDARFKYQGDLNDFVKFSLRGFLSELETLQEEILLFVRRELFRGLVTEMYRAGTISWRISDLLEYLISDRPYLTLEEFRSKRHYMVEAIYKKYKGTKTLQRDLRTMVENRLVIISGGKIYPNLGLLDAVSQENISI